MDIRRKPKPILQYDSRGVFLKRHHSISNACKELNTCPAMIKKVLDKEILFMDSYFWTPENVHLNRQNKLF
jgi:hypothetical protein